MKNSVHPPEGSIDDIRGQIEDVLSSVLQENTFEPNDEVKKLLVQEQIIEQLKPMARKIGGKTAVAPWVTVDFQPDRVEGHIDVSLRFYFSGKPGD